MRESPFGLKSFFEKLYIQPDNLFKSHVYRRIYDTNKTLVRSSDQLNSGSAILI